MGGKHKVANRTKNNARPSSSGRSAELLGSSIPQFVGFSGMKESRFCFPLQCCPEELDSSIDPTIQVMLKKIAKNNPTTKIKGLQELAELIKNAEPETLQTILPVWPKFYNILATDSDNRVREASHNVLHQLVLKAKRNIAPHLKQLMAPWFTSQYDTYPPAASIAKQAFKDTFSDSKFQEAVVFCQEDILSYISDNLLVQTPQTLSNPKHCTPEEMDAKYERVLISCLQGYRLFLEKVPVDSIKNTAELNSNIISNAKFWKFSKHKVANIRASWFKVLAMILQKAPSLLEGKASQVTSTVFGSIEENEPSVLPHVLETILLTMSTIQEWWTHINVEKVLFSKLWKILKQGIEGNSSTFYLNMLPLISHLPPTVDENALQFYNTLFDNFRIGLKQRSSASSRSEYVAVASSFVECLQYVILKKEHDSNLCKCLIKNHLVSTIEWCLIEDQPGYKIVFNQAATLVQWLGRNTKSESFNSYLKFFFENILDLFKETLFNLKEIKNHNLEQISTKQIEFLQSLKHYSKVKKAWKVKFAQDESKKAEEASHQASVIESEEQYLKELNTLVYNVCENYVLYIEEHNSKELLEHVCSLLIDFDTNKFFNCLHEKMKKKNPEARLADVYDNYLHKWLQLEELKSKHVIDLVFMLYKCLDDTDRQKLLDSLSEITDENYLGWCITQALAHPYNKDPLVKKWLKRDGVSQFLASIADKEINDECSSDLDALFRLALTENSDGELYVSNETVLQVIEKLTKFLEHPEEHQTALDTCASLSAYISTIIYTENLLLTYSEDLLLALFRLSCNSSLSEDIISTETLYEVRTAWQDSLSLLAKYLEREESISLVSKLADIVEKEFLNGSLEESHVNHLVEVVANLLKAVYGSQPLWLTDFSNLFVKRSFVETWERSLSSLCSLSEYVKGRLSSPYEELKGIEMVKDLEDLHVAKLFAWTYLKLQVLGTNLADDSEDCEEDEEENEKSKVCYYNVMDENEIFFAEILHIISLGSCYLETFNNTKQYEIILNYYVLAEMKLKSTIQSISTELKEALKTVLRDKCLSEAWLWCNAVYTLFSEINPDALTDIYSDFTKDVTGRNLGFLHLTQTFAKHLNYDHVQNKKYEPIEQVIILNSLMHCEEIDVQIAEVFSKIEEIRSENVPQFLCDNCNMSWEKYQQILETIRLCASLMKHKFNSLTQRHWDFGVISLVSWASNCLKNRSSYQKIQVQALFSEVVQLFINADNQIKGMKEDNVKSSYVSEWDDVLVESIHGDLAQLWLYLAEQLEQNNGNLLQYLPFIQEFSKVINNINHQFIFKTSDTSLPKWSKFLRRSCFLLAHWHPNLQLWGYKMLLALVPGLIKIDTDAVNLNNPHQKGLVFEQFKEKLVETHGIVNSMLMEFKLGEDVCNVKVGTDAFTYTFAYLLIWDILLTLCGEASTELRYQYAEWLRNEDLLNNFLNNLFKLMPTEVLHCNEGKSKYFMDNFLEKPEMHVTDTCNGEKIEYLVCWLYSLAVTQLPALVRQWWTGLETKVAQVVERVTTLYVSQHLCVQELNDIMKHQSQFKNMVIKVMPTAREITAVYTIDEVQVELVISLPANYPLGGLDVQCNKQIGGTNHKQWLLQFKKCVEHQNGRIWDGLSLWNNNLDKKFEGVEECYICYAVLHRGTYQMPKLSCQTCKKKFHSACLVSHVFYPPNETTYA
ncbi:unnamed protein product [Acanthoscelides obtectus]|uniref:E3 ubiquitin-protein ligase listerin n=1 Tax=Acanthoscelides obtectus TaxID=200917 RepID=A0A9P0KP90_ACAOB|nr:unnamed protein product [Acanthoscelides obtectus]CAK1662846.1 E3 ubiquitin-protein ligase listerin [Acanthoscelides obtectus]